MISLYLKNQDVKKIIPGVSRSFSSFFDFRGGFSRSEINFQEVPGVSRCAGHPERISLEYAVSYCFTCNWLRQRSTIFNFYVLKMKREGKPALVKLQCFDVDLYGYKRHWL